MNDDTPMLHTLHLMAGQVVHVNGLPFYLAAGTVLLGSLENVRAARPRIHPEDFEQRATSPVQKPQ